MKRSQAKKQLKASNSISWQAVNVGDSVTGKFERFSPIGENGMLLHLAGAKKPISVGGVLRNLLSNPDNLKLVKKGASVKIVFTGFGKAKKGNATKLFDVFVGGKKLENLVGRTATNEEVNSFFLSSKK